MPAGDLGCFIVTAVAYTEVLQAVGPGPPLRAP